MSTARAAFIAEVLSYVGTPWHHQGRLPGVGLDCPGPLICAARALGSVPPTFDVTGYARVPDGQALQGFCEAHMQRIAYADRQPGDALLVRFQHGHPQHLGVLVEMHDDRQYWVEAEAFRHKRVIKTRLVLTERHTQLVGAYRVPGLDA